MLPTMSRTTAMLGGNWRELAPLGVDGFLEGNDSHVDQALFVPRQHCSLERLGVDGSLGRDGRWRGSLQYRWLGGGWAGHVGLVDCPAIRSVCRGTHKRTTTGGSPVVVLLSLGWVVCKGRRWAHSFHLNLGLLTWTNKKLIMHSSIKRPSTHS